MIVLPAALREKIERHGVEAYPEECCGALLGRASGDRARIQRVEPVQNARKQERQRRYRIGPEDYLRMERLATAEGLDLLGFYHSHPDHPAVPSRYDREHALPFFHYMILAVDSGRPGELGAFLLAEDRDVFAREDLTAEDNGGS